MKQIVSAFKPLTKGEKVVKAFSYKPGKEFASVPVIITENPKADEMYGPFASYIYSQQSGEMLHSYYHPDIEDAVSYAKTEIKDDAEQGNLDPSAGQQRLPFEEAAPKNNPVAKNAGKFNKAQVQTDRKKEQKKGKSVKHKGKDMATESAPVFERYVKPFLNKTPAKMVEFYDREALAIIDRLSEERRSLSESGNSGKLHDVIIGKLRENLSALPETTLTEMRSRRGSYGRRSGFDIGRTGYGDGKGANLGSDKAAFKRREMEVELGDEEPNNYAVYIGGKPWKVFRSERAAQKAANTIKSKYGKDTKVYQTAAPATS